jgi:hypothetical protein
MKPSKIPVLILTFILLSLPLTVSADACACCAEPGQYSISVKKPGSNELAILEEIKFATANLHTSAGYPDDISVIDSLGDSYSINSLFQSRAWKFNFTANKAKTGTLALPMPTSMVAYMANIHDHKPGEGEPILYKEWRFKYKVRQGTGIFQKGIVPATVYFFGFAG